MRNYKLGDTRPHNRISSKSKRKKHYNRLRKTYFLRSDVKGDRPEVYLVEGVNTRQIENCTGVLRGFFSQLAQPEDDCLFVVVNYLKTNGT